MWVLKYEYKHRDCLYTEKSNELGVRVSTFPLNHFSKNHNFYLTAIHTIDGKQGNVKKYLSYLKKTARHSEQITENVIFTQVKVSKNIGYYKSFYNQETIYSTPIIHENGKERIQIASWNRAVLSNILTLLQKNKNTLFLKVLSLKEDKLKDVFLLKAVPKLTLKQRMAFELALENGYYNYPRNVDLGGLSKLMKTSKSNFHEIIRRAESNLFSYFI